MKAICNPWIAILAGILVNNPAAANTEPMEPNRLAECVSASVFVPIIAEQMKGKNSSLLNPLLNIDVSESEMLAYKEYGAFFTEYYPKKAHSENTKKWKSLTN